MYCYAIYRPRRFRTHIPCPLDPSGHRGQGLLAHRPDGIGDLIAVLITLFRKALIGFLRRLAQKWADRRSERMSQEFSLGLAFHSGIRP